MQNNVISFYLVSDKVAVSSLVGHKQLLQQAKELGQLFFLVFLLDLVLQGAR